MAIDLLVLALALLTADEKRFFLSSFVVIRLDFDALPFSVFLSYWLIARLSLIAINSESSLLCLLIGRSPKLSSAGIASTP